MQFGCIRGASSKKGLETAFLLKLPLQSGSVISGQPANDLVDFNWPRLCRENQAVVIEDLNVKGMLSNVRLSKITRCDY